MYNISTTTKVLVAEDNNIDGDGSITWSDGRGFNNNYIVYGGWPGVKVYNIITETTTTVRSTGDTRNIFFNPSDDTILINTKGYGQDPDEWDITLVQLP